MGLGVPQYFEPTCTFRRMLYGSPEPKAFFQRGSSVFFTVWYAWPSTRKVIFSGVHSSVQVWNSPSLRSMRLGVNFEVIVQFSPSCV